MYLSRLKDYVEASRHVQLGRDEGRHVADVLGVGDGLRHVAAGRVVVRSDGAEDRGLTDVWAGAPDRPTPK